MAISRATAVELARLLEATARPIYVVDDRRQIAYCNASCAAWLGWEASDLIGQVCNYHSDPQLVGAAAFATALCPPPEVFGNSRITARIAPPGIDGDKRARQVEFIPLTQGSEAVTVLALGSAEAAPAVEGAIPDDPDAAELHARLQRFRREFAGRFELDRLAGTSPAMRRVRNQVRLCGASPASVLVVGPPGSGCRHVARAIHYASGSTKAGNLVPLSCATLNAELMQDGIRTLAQARNKSPERLGTLLLIEVERLPADAQAELAGFMVLAELPFRVVSTSRLPLADLVSRGKFRRELASLISTVTIDLPSLTGRVEDVPLLAQLFLEDFNARGERQLSGFTPEALDRLAAYPWPGEVAELAQFIAQSAENAEGPLVGTRDLPERIALASEAEKYAREPETTIDLVEFLGRIELELIERALAQSKGNKTKAARLLGMTRPRLYRRLVQLGLEQPTETPVPTDEVIDFEEEA